MNVAENVTVEIDKGDILGTIFAAIPGIVGLCVIGGVVVSWLMGGTVNLLKDCGFLVVVLGILSLVGWGMWEFGHWFTST